MRWNNHEFIALAAPLAMGEPIIIILGSCLFAVFPDAVEGGPPGQGWFRHRGWTHTVGVWIVLLTILKALVYLAPDTGFFIYVWAVPGGLRRGFELLWMSAVWGIGTHLAADSLTKNGIWLIKRKKIAFGLFKTGSIVEYFIAYGVLAAALWIRSGHSSGWFGRFI